MYFEIRVFMRFGYNYVKELLELLWGCLEVGKLVKHDGCYIMRIMVQGFPKVKVCSIFGDLRYYGEVIGDIGSVEVRNCVELW